MSNAVIGLIIGEGSFQIALYQRDANKFGIQSRPSFTLDLHIQDAATVEHVYNKTGIGHFNTYKNNESARWETNTGKGCDALERYIKHHSGPLWESSMKSKSFERWCDLREDRARLMKTKSGMHRLVDRAAEVNTWGESKTDWHQVIEDNA